MQKLSRKDLFIFILPCKNKESIQVHPGGIQTENSIAQKTALAINSKEINFAINSKEQQNNGEPAVEQITNCLHYPRFGKLFIQQSRERRGCFLSILHHESAIGVNAGCVLWCHAVMILQCYVILYDITQCH
ncbi:hypothetical protein Y1Q_0018934 [Alligator mississippiensis]|uniref:Uncharacterized protein n=1 Tax=Alligator mississippiensis TaxID=8496 RepID=A0A151M386_ALLMI|nr:hypothetical protein Y1Q_0018934 [Alligator mississippiensis]